MAETACAIQKCSDTKIECETGAHKPPELSEVKVYNSDTGNAKSVQYSLIYLQPLTLASDGLKW